MDQIKLCWSEGDALAASGRYALPCAARKQRVIMLPIAYALHLKSAFQVCLVRTGFNGNCCT